MIRKLIKSIISPPQQDLAPLAAERQANWSDASAVKMRIREIVAEVVETELEQVTSDALIYRLGSSNDALEVVKLGES